MISVGWKICFPGGKQGCQLIICQRSLPKRGDEEASPLRWVKRRLATGRLPLLEGARSNVSVGLAHAAKAVGELGLEKAC